MIKRISTFLLVLILLLLSSCDQGAEKHTNNKFIQEYDIIEIDLLGELSDRSSEISGLCWFSDNLIILPQYPQRFSNDVGKIFYISKERLKKYIDGTLKDAIKPSSYNIDLTKIAKYFKSGSGFESISIIDTTVFFTIEHISSGSTETLLVKGEMDSSANEIIIDETSIITVPADIQIFNMSCESLLTFNDSLYPIFEAFGKNVNTYPKVAVFDNELNFVRKIDFPTVEYRITDVTSIDDSGRFWAINYFYPGDKNKLNPAIDNIIQIHGIGESNSQYDPVERLLQFQLTDNGITITKYRPIYIKLKNNEGRNWEGLAKFDSLGFLIATDRYPETILAFLPFSNP
jgi:hypothetical protein